MRQKERQCSQTHRKPHAATRTRPHPESAGRTAAEDKLWVALHAHPDTTTADLATHHRGASGSGAAEDLTEKGQTDATAIVTRRHDEPVNVELVGLLCPGDCSAHLIVDDRDEPAQGCLPEIINVFLQVRYPVVPDQDGLDGVGSALDSQQRAGKLRVRAGTTSWINTAQGSQRRSSATAAMLRSRNGAPAAFSRRARKRGYGWGFVIANAVEPVSVVAVGVLVSGDSAPLHAGS